MLLVGVIVIITFPTVSVVGMVLSCAYSCSYGYHHPLPVVIAILCCFIVLVVVTVFVMHVVLMNKNLWQSSSYYCHDRDLLPKARGRGCGRSRCSLAGLGAGPES